MKLKKLIPAAVLTLAMAVSFGGVAFAGGRTSDEVIRKQYSHPVGYDPAGKAKDKYAMYEANAAAMGLTDNYEPDNDSNPPIKKDTVATNVNTNNAATNTQKQSSDGNVETASSGLFLKAELYTIEYVKHKVATDYDGNPCLVYYYTFTNLDSEPRAPFIVSLYAYQNGVQCDRATYISKEEDSNAFKNVMTGTSITAYDAYKLTDMSDVTMEAPEFLKDNKATQVISLK